MNEQEFTQEDVEREDIRRFHWLLTQIRNNISARDYDTDKMKACREALDEYDMLASYLIQRYINVFKDEDKIQAQLFLDFLDSEVWKEDPKHHFKELSKYHNLLSSALQGNEIDGILKKEADLMKDSPDISKKLKGKYSI